jgi:phosphate-selective porin OprO/OprP
VKRRVRPFWSLVSIALAPGAVLAREPGPAPAPPAEAAPAEAGSVSTQQLDEIDQRSRIVARKIELLEEQAVAASASSPVLSAGDKGFNWKSADGAFVLKVRGLVQGDSRQYLDDSALKPNDTFVVRAVKPLIEATFGDVADFRFMADFGNGQSVAGAQSSVVSVQDAYGDLRPFAWLALRAGKFKGPVGLERLQGDAGVILPERGLPTALAPNRDIGFMLHGLIGPGVLGYEAGIFNGVVDGGSGDADINHAKDFAGRLFVQPWRGDPYSFLYSFGVGFAATTGNQRGRATATSLPGYKTSGLNTFFSYLVNDKDANGTVIAHGRHSRFAPQAYYFYGPVGLLGEYTVSQQEVQKGASAATLNHSAWQVLASFVLGGKPTYEGVLVENPLNPRKGGWGALELAGRYNALKLDGDTFPTYADPTKSASQAKGFGVALNWHWSRNIKLVAAFERTKFEGGGKPDRPTENVAVQRIQAVF